jgi:hypothetical protein
MGSRYLFIVLYTFLEAHLSRGDYSRPGGFTEETPASGDGAPSDDHRRRRRRSRPAVVVRPDEGP